LALPTADDLVHEMATVLPGTLVSAAPIMGQPSDLAVTGGVIWVRDATGDPGLHLLDAASGELLHSLGARGDGPGEFSFAPFGLMEDAEDPGVIWAWDAGHQRLTRFEPRSPTEYQVRTVQLEGSTTVQRVVRNGEGGVIGIAGSADSRFVVFSTAGLRQLEVAHPLPGPLGADPRSRINAANQAITACEWPGRGFVISHAQYGRIEYFDPRGAAVRRASVPAPSDPIFEVNSAGVPTFRWREAHYVDCTVAGDLLYALFSGRVLSSHDGEAAASGSRIHVFDWSGQLRGRLRLDRDVSKLAIEPDGSGMFASSLVDAGIHRFPLSSWVPSDDH
jgi:hypothetical protein